MTEGTTTTLEPNALDGRQLKAMLYGALENLRQHQQEVDALNVFPVPDGDTGANMTLTMQSAWREIENLTTSHVGTIMKAASHGAIRGARGNSGVILSQIFRGMAEIMEPLDVLDAPSLARAFRQGQKVAYHGVMHPVEGTILTIIRAIADASEHAVALSQDIAFLLTISLDKARDTLQQTPDMLPVLKEAGVVDAGGAGLLYLLEGMAKVALGKPVLLAEPQADASPSTPNLNTLADEWGYDIQFLVYDAPENEEEIRKKLVEMGGESIVVGRAGRITKVHVHSDNPGPFLAYGAALGQLDDIVVENMTLQTLRRKGLWQEDASLFAPHAAQQASHHCADIIAVAAGDGFAKVFRSLGACEVVAGGQTMNPSTDDLVRAIERAPGDEVILLPNNKNIIMAAHQATQLSSKKVFVIESKTLPEGIAALLAYNPQLSIAENAAIMQTALSEVHTIEVTRAVRQATLHGVGVQQDQAIALIDGRLCCAGEGPEEVALQALASILEADHFDVITIYFGQPIGEERAQQLGDQIQNRYPDLEVEVVEGGQPHYHYIISVE